LFSLNLKFEIMHGLKKIILFVFLATSLSCADKISDTLDLSDATIWISPALESTFQETVRTVLAEEVEKRTGLALERGDTWKTKTVIALALDSDDKLYSETVPSRSRDHPEYKKEGYRLVHESKDGKDILWVLGADARGVLYGVGKLLRTSQMDTHKISLPKSIDFSESPMYPMRGHQF